VVEVPSSLRGSVDVFSIEHVLCNVPDLASLGNAANVCVGSIVYRAANQVDWTTDMVADLIAGRSTFLAKREC
jgi:hypothetical protein